MRGFRSGFLVVLLLTAGVATAVASPRPPLFQSGRYAALGAGGSLGSKVFSMTSEGSSRVVPTLAFRASTGRQRPNTYARISLPADGSANVSFIVDDDRRQPEVYLSLQLRGAAGHVSLQASSSARGEPRPRVLRCPMISISSR